VQAFSTVKPLITGPFLIAFFVLPLCISFSAMYVVMTTLRVVCCLFAHGSCPLPCFEPFTAFRHIPAGNGYAMAAFSFLAKHISASLPES
jgi:hypothetical protein